MKSDLVIEKKGQPFTDSLIIAERSENQHESIVRLINDNTQDFEEYGKIEFSDFKSGKRGRPTKVYFLNEQQATLLLTYLNNSEPVKAFKRNLVREFYRMKEFINSLQTTKIEFPEFTEAIMNAHDEPKHYHFSNEVNMINKIALGVTAKEFKVKNGIDNAVASIRPYLTEEQIKMVQALQRFDIGLIEIEPDYQKRKETLQDYYLKLCNRKLIA